MGIFSAVDSHALSLIRETGRRFNEHFIREGIGGPDYLLGFDHDAAVKDLTLEHKVTRKLIGRIYACRWRWTVSVDLGSKPMEARFQYSGWRMQSRSGSFRGEKTSKILVERLNSSDIFAELCGALDLMELKVLYRPASKDCEIVIAPNYGDFVWLMLPPTKYVRQPTHNEVKATAVLIKELSLLVRDNK